MISPALSDVQLSADIEGGGNGAPRPAVAPTVWGLNPSELHDRFWASRGVQVVRQGEPSEIVAHAGHALKAPDKDNLLDFVARLAGWFEGKQDPFK